jgi:cytochrome c554/c'-like protein
LGIYDVLALVRAAGRGELLRSLTLNLLSAMSLIVSVPAGLAQKPILPPVASASSNQQKFSAGSYAGVEACRPCHREKVETFLRTAHHLTSRLPDKSSIIGSFNSGGNILKTANPELFFRMDANNEGYFQTAIEGIPPYTTSRTERFDFVVGSGGKGQTYLFWKGDQLFQLPVSYWTELGQWVNSPGYRDGVVNFERPVIPRCLECHATYFESQPPPANRYRKTGFVLGIACEKCHGRSREHIEHYHSKLDFLSGEPIVNPARLTRDRQIDLCAWCHAGAGDSLATPFSYVPGEPLEKYLKLPRADANAQLDVHGSQVELLEKSRCFQSSGMTCSTCHDVHTPQHDLAAFSARCLTCHKVERCGVYPKQGREIANKCIDCHMPNQESNLIVSEVDGRKIRPRVRNHWIKVYPTMRDP